MKRIRCGDCFSAGRDSDLIYLSEDGLWCPLDDREDLTKRGDLIARMRAMLTRISNDDHVHHTDMIRLIDEAGMH